MRLTTYIRDAFVNSVMNDIPSVDYHASIYKAVFKDVMSQLPANVREIWEDDKTNEYLHKQYQYFGNVAVMLPHQPNGAYWKLSPDGEMSVKELVSKKKAQESLHATLRGRVKRAAYGCTTRKTLAELLPEFEKYLPAEEEKTCRTLPVVANLMVDLVKAGWPKDGRTKPSIKPQATTA